MPSENVSKKVLVVDDETDLRDLASEVLKPKGYRVFTAENGQEGLEIYKKENPDLVLTDVNMKLMDGLELTREIKKLNPEAKVYLVTGYTNDSVIEDFMALGAAGYIGKPYLIGDLIKLVEEGIGE